MGLNLLPLLHPKDPGVDVNEKHQDVLLAMFRAAENEIERAYQDTMPMEIEHAG